MAGGHERWEYLEYVHILVTLSHIPSLLWAHAGAGENEQWLKIDNIVMGEGIRVSKHTLSFLRFLWEPSVLLSWIFHLALFPHTAYCKSGQLYQAILNVKHVQVHEGNAMCVCLCVWSLTLNRPCLWLCWPSHTPLPGVSSIWGGSITRS